MKKIGKVFGLLILMLMLGVAGAGIYDWGKDRWVAPVSQKMEGEVRPNAEVEEQRRLLKERMSRPPPKPPPGSVAEVRGMVRDLAPPTGAQPPDRGVRRSNHASPTLDHQQSGERVERRSAAGASSLLAHAQRYA